MAKKEQQEVQDDFIKEVFRMNNKDIASTGIKQCTDGHEWRKVDATNIACTKCPTMLQIHKKDIKNYVK